MPQSPNILLVADHSNFDRDATKHLENPTPINRNRLGDSLGYSGVHGYFEGVPVIILRQKEPYMTPTGAKWPMVVQQELGAERIISLMPMRRMSTKTGLGQFIIADSAHGLLDRANWSMLKVTANLPSKGQLSAVPDRFLLENLVYQVQNYGASYYLRGPVLSLVHEQVRQPKASDLQCWERQGVLAQDALTYAFYLQARSCSVRALSMGVATAGPEEHEAAPFDPSAHLSTATFAALKAFSQIERSVTPF